MFHFHHPFRVVIVFVALAIVGVALVPGLRVNFTPTYIKPAITITYGLPNSSPDIVERLATAPLENALSQVAGIKKIYSISKYNGGTIELSFDKKEDMAFRKFEVNAIIRNIYKKLPERLSYPRVEQRGGDTQNKEESPILFYSVNGPFAPYKIQQEITETLKKPLSQLNEVKEVAIFGANPLQITVDFDTEKLLRYGLTKASITQAISAFTDTSYPGIIEMAAGQRFFLKTSGTIPDISMLEQAVIKVVDKKRILLKDVARLYIEEQSPKSYQRINAQNAVYLNVYAREQVNKIVLARKIRSLMDELKGSLMDGMELRLERDDTAYLHKEMNKVYTRTGLSVLILVIFIFVINRRIKYLFTLFLGIIVNLCITAIIIYALRVELHIFSIAGLTISFGLIVDNAIVMLDHLHRKRNSRIFVALLAASLTTIMALLMVLLLPEEERRDLTDFSIVVAINLGVSLLIALFFTPALYLLLFKEKTQGKRAFSLSIKAIKRRVRWFGIYSKAIYFLARYRKAFIVVIILGFGLPVFKLPIQWEGQEWYNKTIGSDRYQDGIRPVTDKVLGGALRKFVTEVYEGWVYKEPQQTKLYVNARLPFGTTLQDANFVIGKVEEYLLGVKGLDKFVTNVNNRTARIEITFGPAYENSSLPYQLKARLQARSIDLTGVAWSIYGVGRGFSVGGERSEVPNFRVKMKGYNYDELGRQAETMAGKLLVNKRVQEVKTNQQIGWGREKTSEYVLEFEVPRLASAGISRSQVMQMLGDFSNPSAAAIRANYRQEKIPIFIKAEGAEGFSKFDMMEKALPLDTSRFLKVKDYASLSFEVSANEIHKEDRQYLRIVAFDYMGSYKFGARHRDQVVETMNRTMPVGYEVQANDRYFSFSKTERDYGLLALLMVGIFFICAILFENLKQPLYIIFTIPISFIGLFLIFSLFDFSFDQGGYAAFVMLGGLVVNASIFVVNDLNNTSWKHYNRAVVRSVLGKAQPIILTILSTCFGLVPFLMEGENEVFWFALAIGTIGGLIFSIVAVFVCLPVFLIKRKAFIMKN